MLVALTCPRVYSLDGKVKDSLCGTPGIIIPSQGVIIYFKSHGDPVVELEVSKEYVLTCKAPSSTGNLLINLIVKSFYKMLSQY